MDQPHSRPQLTLVCAERTKYWARDPLDFIGIEIKQGRLMLPRLYIAGEVVYSQKLLVAYQFKTIATIHLTPGGKLKIAFTQFGNTLTEAIKMDIVELIEVKLSKNPALYEAYMTD